MSNRIVIDQKELEDRIAEAFRESKFSQMTSPDFVVSSHPVNPLSKEELVERLNLVFDSTSPYGYPKLLKDTFDKNYLSKVGKSRPEDILMIIYKNRVVWKFFINEKNWYGGSYDFDKEHNTIKLVFTFENKKRLSDNI